MVVAARFAAAAVPTSGVGTSDDRKSCCALTLLAFAARRRRAALRKYVEERLARTGELDTLKDNVGSIVANELSQLQNDRHNGMTSTTTKTALQKKVRER